MSTMELALGACDPDEHGVDWRPCSLASANSLLAERHYLGPIRQGRHTFGGFAGGRLVAVQVWKAPTARYLPADGTWLELARWCLTEDAGPDAGSRMHKRAVRSLRDALPMVTTLVSYSDPSHGHGGSLYRACNWLWAPTWHRLRPPPSGLGSWDGVTRQEVKDRWIFPLRPDWGRDEIVRVHDQGAIRAFLASDEAERCARWPIAVPLEVAL